MELIVTPVTTGVSRVVVDGRCAGYVVEVGRVFVSLRGAVYNTSTEVGQTLSFESAVRMLARDLVGVS